MFAKILEQFNQGDIEYAEIKDALISTLTSSPQMHNQVSQLLNSDVGELKLTAGQKSELLGIVYEITQSGDEGKTRFADSTRLAANTLSNAAPATPEPEQEPVLNSDGTVLSSGRTTAPAQPSVQDADTTNPDMLKAGDTIKGRFVLEQIIGQGGMGVVFKARDLRKEEAMDRNPFVAIKVLGEAFKDHPQALIALQRESRKAQTLAHPNIVTVFDFDRDGDIVYMTMEYLEGSPLDKLIKEHYPKPFDKERALKIINGICAGMAYAHSHNIIHSDLKPGNIYVTENNDVKIFDFGIARAMKKKEGDQDVDELTGETTVFDAGDLGGLTPAYASFEMLTGEQPDIRDDIYALACMSYEMLAGQHPFNKLPANQAKKRNLSPAPVANISRKQTNGLLQGLSFDREKCSPSVLKFQDDLCNTKTFSKGLIGLAVAAAIVTLGGASIPIMNYLDDQEIARIVSTLNSKDEQIIANTLGSLNALDTDIREGVLNDAKETVIKYYEQKVERETDTDKGKFNFGAATRLLQEVKILYPDSAQIESVTSRINSRKNTLLNDITNRFNRHIEEENLTAKSKSDDLIDTLSEISLIDKNHPLLNDPRISIAYTQAAQKAAKGNNLRYAEQLIATGLVLLPKDTSLINMQDAIAAAKAESGGAGSQMAMLQRSLEKSTTPAQRKSKIEYLLQKPFKNRQWNTTLTLQYNYLKETVSADDPWLKKYDKIVRDSYLKQARKMREASRFAEANNIIRSAKTIVASTPSLLSEEKKILTAKLNYEKSQQAKSKLARTEGIKQTLLTQAKANDVKGAKESLNKLLKILPAGDSFIADKAPKSIAFAYLRLAKSSARRGDYKSATALVKAGLDVSPNHNTLKLALESYQSKAPKAATTTASRSNDPCQLNYAGHGKRSRAVCSDKLDANSHGPSMVVIPKGSSINQVYAISKYEISIADYNIYCKSSKSCNTKSGTSNRPITNISFSQAKEYSQWLSTKTGYTYRIPTEAEWIHAAKAQGKQPPKDFNCQVSMGGNLLKGVELLNIHSGKSNGWGLINYIGNAQEWAQASATRLVVRGGSFKDPLSLCDISLSRKHNGKSDNITGFRLVRELKI